MRPAPFWFSGTRDPPVIAPQCAVVWSTPPIPTHRGLCSCPAVTWQIDDDHRVKTVLWQFVAGSSCRPVGVKPESSRRACPCAFRALHCFTLGLGLIVAVCSSTIFQDSNRIDHFIHLHGASIEWGRPCPIPARSTQIYLSSFTETGTARVIVSNTGE